MGVTVEVDAGDIVGAVEVAVGVEGSVRVADGIAVGVDAEEEAVALAAVTVGEAGGREDGEIGGGG